MEGAAGLSQHSLARAKGICLGLDPEGSGSKVAEEHLEMKNLLMVSILTSENLLVW